MSTISVIRPKWDAETLKSRDVDVKASAGTIEAMAGHLLYKQADGSYKAYPVATAVEDAGFVGVLGEDVKLSTTAKKCRVIEAGIVYIQAVRDAGIAATKVSDEAIRDYSANKTAITFVDYSVKEAYHGV